MELLSRAVVQQTFDKISAAFVSSPKNFEEYEELVRKSASDLFQAASICKVEYALTVSSSFPFIDDLPDGVALYCKEGECAIDGKSLLYPFFGGEVRFNLSLTEKLTEENEKILEDVIRQLFYVLQGMVMELLCKQLLVYDYEMKIPNTKAFMSFAEKLISEKKIDGYTALYFNIRNFKSVHKKLTYLEGDEALAEYCKIIVNALSKDEIVARLGGDNFVALILDENSDYFYDLIQNMVVNYKRRSGEELTFMFGATVGAAKLENINDSGEIMMQISTAYQHTRDDREQFEYYDPSLSSELIERKNVLSKFFKALTDGEFFPMFQPKVCIKTRQLIGAEALVRWRNKDGIMMPNSFISILEADGCITALDFFVLEQVCRFIAGLIAKGIEPVKISVNFSKRHLSNNKLVEEIVEVIDRYHVPHKYIEVELTEGEDFHNHSVMKNVVDDLGTLGIKTSIDDFGTGYSSLAMLKTISIDVLKIDKSFIPDCPINKQDKSCLMFDGVVRLAKSLGLTTIVEGVETDEQLEFVDNMGCDIVQGFIFDKPLSEDDFIERLIKRVYSRD